MIQSIKRKDEEKNMQTIQLNSEEETLALGRNIAQTLKIGDILVLTGDLGAGKTKLTEGILDFFGLANEIASPTFTLINEYPTKTFPIYHFDVYRLSNSDEFLAIGGEEYFEKGVSIIEWGEIIEDILPEHYTQITFAKDLENENKRILTIQEK